MKSRICLSLMLVSGMLFPGMAMAKETIYYFHNDHLGTPQAMSDQNGRVVWKAEYEPFGQAFIDEDPDQDGLAVTCNLRFPGQYFDAETGLHYNYHRDYDPSTGRYLEADPIGLQGGMNQYAYVRNNSVNWIDPEGLNPAAVLAYPPAWILLPAGAALYCAINQQGFRDLIDSIGDAIEAFKDECSDDRPCVPPEGTQCYEGPDYGKPHGGVSPHYHIYEMQKKRPSGTCFWRYLGGEVGAGVLGTPSAGMESCSSYPNFTGRGSR